MKSAVHSIFFATLLVTAAAQAQLPAVQKSGTAEYVSGGVGDEESDAFKSAARQWPLTLEFSAQEKARAVFIADVNLQIRDAAGQVVLLTSTKGPYLLARLAPGQYDIEAIYKGQTLKKRINIPVAGNTREVFSWPGMGTGSVK